MLTIQKDMFIVGSELYTPKDQYHKLVASKGVVTSEMVNRLEGLIEGFEEEVEMPKEFTIPGGCASSAALDLARTVIRRAERRVVELKSEGLIQNEEVLKYLNRLADLVFTLARYEEKG